MKDLECKKSYRVGEKKRALDVHRSDEREARRVCLRGFHRQFAAEIKPGQAMESDRLSEVL